MPSKKIAICNPHTNIDIFFCELKCYPQKMSKETTLCYLLSALFHHWHTFRLPIQMAF